MINDLVLYISKTEKCKLEDIKISSSFDTVMEKDKIEVKDIFNFIDLQVRIKNTKIDDLRIRLISEMFFIEHVPINKRNLESQIYKKSYPDRYEIKKEEIKTNKKEPQQIKLF